MLCLFVRRVSSEVDGRLDATSHEQTRLAMAVDEVNNNCRAFYCHHAIVIGEKIINNLAQSYATSIDHSHWKQ